VLNGFENVILVINGLSLDMKSHLSKKPKRIPLADVRVKLLEYKLGFHVQHVSKV
jgi:hypothetical protein